MKNIGQLDEEMKSGGSEAGSENDMKYSFMKDASNDEVDQC